MQYVYDFAALERVPEGPTSAKVAAKKLLSGPTLQTSKSSTIGAVLTGANLIVALAGQARGSGARILSELGPSLDTHRSPLSGLSPRVLRSAQSGNRLIQSGGAWVVSCCPGLRPHFHHYK